MIDLNNPVVTATWLQSVIDKRSFGDKLCVFDATYHLTDKTRDPHAEWLAEHIPGARHFDITSIADTASPWPNTVPSPAQFEAAVTDLGVHQDSTIIAYDRLGMFSAARVWWLFRLFGHNEVAVLDGGLPAWNKAGFATEQGPATAAIGDFQARLQPQWLHSIDEVNAARDEAGCAILDARGGARFRGEAPEPREGLRAGHIPGSFNVHYGSVLNDDHTFRSGDEIRAAVNASGIDAASLDDLRWVTSCGSGVTACIVSIALLRAGLGHSAVFDGSWTEWGSTVELPVAT